MPAEIGTPAPDFTLPSDRGEITLSSYRGKTNVLLAFYPGDFSPVCTSEMQCFADDWTKFRELGAEILGISTDPIEKHIEFSKKLGLQFPLLSDRNREVSRQYGVAGLFGSKRAYFIIDIEGIVRFKYIEFLPVFKREDSELLVELRKLKGVG
ncbi:alkyl hydroperoxide reductase/ Thiol specific antioxidant/ Mal allergen [Thalassoporum mexicanum PCC 7367]|uniref:peroxiredoxin n=1 Tax=Thalassoporum mexicanum TaxID=3457544 RepID=UPI00029FCD64|nr:peroxiredoxin [Pseudanabaena sp. PCC 7367]AFY68471.1 alkyl hydroperoxide reductase/ Thiol specific antioxidant/ Mal allergen [Pseudanabaena sp. PCC 7367]